MGANSSQLLIVNRMGLSRSRTRKERRKVEILFEVPFTDYTRTCVATEKPEQQLSSPLASVRFSRLTRLLVSTRNGRTYGKIVATTRAKRVPIPRGLT